MRNLNNYDDFMLFLADAFDPFCVICADKDVAAAFRSGGRISSVVSLICRKYSSEIAAVLAALEGITAEEFKAKFSPVELFAKVTDLLNSGAVKELFASAQQTEGASSSGTVPEATQE